VKGEQSLLPRGRKVNSVRYFNYRLRT